MLQTIRLNQFYIILALSKKGTHLISYDLNILKECTSFYNSICINYNTKYFRKI